MSAIYEALEKGILISDGAMGTMLQTKGLTDGGAPELPQTHLVGREDGYRCMV